MNIHTKFLTLETWPVHPPLFRTIIHVHSLRTLINEPIVFATCRYLDFSKLPIGISNKLFNSLLLSILLYGSEAWSCYGKDDLNNWEKDVVEKTHVFLCKYTLSVNKRCPNAAARNDLGRLPLKSLTDISCINFWLHLNKLPSKNIAKQCLQLSEEMAEKNQPGLMQKIKSLCNKSNLTLQTLNNTNEKAFTSHIKQYLRRALADHQLTR